jgi:hypothetical protein
MPIIAQIMIPGTLEIAVREKINRCGCLDLVTESERMHTTVEDIRRTASQINGVVCQGDHCCVSDIVSFAEKLKKFRSER